jgi:hypothetical protein
MIEFVVSSSYVRKAGAIPIRARIYHWTLPVELDVLSQVARTLANSILTTDNADDLSLVYVRDQKTIWERQVELAEKMYLDADSRLEYLATIKRMYFSEVGQRHRHGVITWRWDTLKWNETPEEYFERHSRAILDQGGLVLGNPYNKTFYRGEQR